MIYITKLLEVVFRQPHINKKSDGPCAVGFKSIINMEIPSETTKSDKYTINTLGIPNVFLNDDVPLDEATWITVYTTLSDGKRDARKKTLSPLKIYNSKYNKSVDYYFSYLEVIGDKQ